MADDRSSLPDPRTNSTTLTRRRFLQTAAATGVAASGLQLAQAEQPVTQQQFPAVINPKPGGALRVVHMTDWHLLNQRLSLKGIEAALDHAKSLNPDAILNTGDMITHGMARPQNLVQSDMAKIEKAFKRTADLRSINAIGNHDIFGWNHAKSAATGNEPIYGKKWWVDTFGEGQRYRATQLGPWRVYVLDSIHPDMEGGYIAGLDDQQFNWLEHELDNLSFQTPVLVLTHAPIINGSALLIDGDISPEGYRLNRSGLFIDAWRVVDLFSRHPNVRLALSGHMHMLDRVDFQGMSYICDGAVCGNWWRPSEVARTTRKGDPPDLVRPKRASPGYGLIDLFPDGRFEHQYVQFPWAFQT